MVEKRAYLNMSEVISRIEYVPLETSSLCLIGEVFHASISENYILVFSNSNLFLFSREGRFIRSIGQRGGGPEDYRYDLYNVHVDEKTDMVYLMGSNDVYAYHISGKFVKKLDLLELRKTNVFLLSLTILPIGKTIFFLQITTLVREKNYTVA